MFIWVQTYLEMECIISKYDLVLPQKELLGFGKGSWGMSLCMTTSVVCKFTQSPQDRPRLVFNQETTINYLTLPCHFSVSLSTFSLGARQVGSW